MYFIQIIDFHREIMCSIDVNINSMQLRNVTEQNKRKKLQSLTSETYEGYEIHDRVHRTYIRVDMT